MKDEIGRPELVERIRNGSGLHKKQVEEVLDLEWLTIARLLKEAEAEADGSKRVEVWGGVIVDLHMEEESAGHGVAEGTIEPQHFRFNIKLHKAARDVMAQVLGFPVKNC